MEDRGPIDACPGPYHYSPRLIAHMLLYSDFLDTIDARRQPKRTLSRNQLGAPPRGRRLQFTTADGHLSILYQFIFICVWTRDIKSTLFWIIFTLIILYFFFRINRWSSNSARTIYINSLEKHYISKLNHILMPHNLNG